MIINICSINNSIFKCTWQICTAKLIICTIIFWFRFSYSNFVFRYMNGISCILETKTLSYVSNYISCSFCIIFVTFVICFCNNFSCSRNTSFVRRIRYIICGCSYSYFIPRINSTCRSKGVIRFSCCWRNNTI